MVLACISKGISIYSLLCEALEGFYGIFSMKIDLEAVWFDMPFRLIVNAIYLFLGSESSYAIGNHSN